MVLEFEQPNAIRIQEYSIRIVRVYQNVSGENYVIANFLIDSVAFCLSAFSCNFDPRDLCGFTQRSNDKFDWTRRRGSTPSQGTGPDGDHTGRGYYMYIEASSRKTGDTAVLDKSLTLSGDHLCLTFYYHMIGQHIGTLNVYVGSDKVFSKTGKQSRRWSKAEVALSQTGSQTVRHNLFSVVRLVQLARFHPYVHVLRWTTIFDFLSQLSFEGIRGSGFLGDIAIDDVSVGQCSGQGQERRTIMQKYTLITTNDVFIE
ncbi:hypothetical protein QZH41_014417 [Actinostola sp. cb2023]|nr:hypothetical protein QZH41_014417 [Actinostola sp. cb2023]